MKNINNKKLGILLFTVMACTLYAPVANAMQKKTRVQEMKEKLEQELARKKQEQEMQIKPAPSLEEYETYKQLHARDDKYQKLREGTIKKTPPIVPERKDRPGILPAPPSIQEYETYRKQHVKDDKYQKLREGTIKKTPPIVPERKDRPGILPVPPSLQEYETYRQKRARDDKYRKLRQEAEAPSLEEYEAYRKQHAKDDKYKKLREEAGKHIVGRNKIVDDYNQTSCVICLDDFTNDKELVKLSCGHIFCKDCINGWLSGINEQTMEALIANDEQLPPQQNECPSCRKQVLINFSDEEINDLKNTNIIKLINTKFNDKDFIDKILSLAAKDANAQILQELIRRKVNINKTIRYISNRIWNSDSQTYTDAYSTTTPLHQVVSNDDRYNRNREQLLAIVKLLVEQGKANLNTTDSNGRLAIDCAERGSDIYNYLARKMGRPEVRQEMLQWAGSTDHIENPQAVLQGLQPALPDRLRGVRLMLIPVTVDRIYIDRYDNSRPIGEGELINGLWNWRFYYMQY